MEWRFESAADIYPSTLHAQIMAELRAHGVPESDFDAAELIFGELVSNVIRYARGKVSVRLEWTGDFPRLFVCDEGRYALPAIGLPADPLSESGRGLYIIQALAKDFQLVDAPKGGSTACATLPVRRRTA